MYRTHKQGVSKFINHRKNELIQYGRSFETNMINKHHS